MSAPKPEAIDALIREFAEKQTALSLAQGVAKGRADELAGVKAKLIEMVQAHGVPHAKKSKLLQGLHNKATVTVGTRTEVDDAAVDKLFGYLEKQDVPELRQRFFTEHVSYQLVETPAEVLKGLDLAKKVRAGITRLLGRCWKVQTNQPSLKVEVVEAVKP